MPGDLKIYLKREDLNHIGTHKINHCMGEALLAKLIGKKKLIAETGASQLQDRPGDSGGLLRAKMRYLYGEADIEKQSPNVAKMNGCIVKNTLKISTPIYSI